MKSQFPTQVLTGLIRSFVCETAESIGADPSFVALPVLSTMAAAIGNSRAIQLRPGWVEPCIIWTAIIAEPGSSKSPAIKAAVNPLIELQQTATPIERKVHSVQNFANARYHSRATDSFLSIQKALAPTHAQLVTSDTSVARLAVLLQANPRGLLLVRDELAGWVENVEKRLGGDHWLSIHSGCSLTVDRANGRSSFVRRAAVSITGGFQPAVLQRSLLANRQRENGLAARFLFGWPATRKPAWTDSPIRPELVSQYTRMLLRLLELAPTQIHGDPFEPVTVRLTSAAKLRFKDYFNESAEQQLALSCDLAATWPKLRAYAARLALVIAFAQWAETDEPLPPELVDLDSMEASIQMTNWFAEQAKSIYCSNRSDKSELWLQRALNIIRNRGGVISSNELRRFDRAISSTHEAEQILMQLVKDRFGTWEICQIGDKGGRPTRRFVLTTAET